MIPILKCLKCRCFNQEKMLHTRKIFKKANFKLARECDIISIMDQVRKSKSFLRNHLSHEQRILQKFDCRNVIDASSSSGADSGERPSDVDEIMVHNLSHKSGLVAMFTLGKLDKILKPYTEVEKLPEFDLKLFKSFFSKDANMTDDMKNVFEFKSKTDKMLLHVY
jgi:hypothetical protein